MYMYKCYIQFDVTEISCTWDCIFIKWNDNDYGNILLACKFAVVLCMYSVFVHMNNWIIKSKFVVDSIDLPVIMHCLYNVGVCNK